MEGRLTTKAIFFHWQSIVMLVVFFALKGISFFLGTHDLAQAILVFFILMTLGFLYFKNPDLAWCMVVGEIFLGGSGHYLEFINLSIRALIIGTFLTLWGLHTVAQGIVRKHFHLETFLTVFLALFYVFIGFAVFNGMSHGHALRSIIQDLVPFLYLPLIFPAFHILAKESAQEFFIRLLLVFLIGSAIFSLFTLALFSTGVVELQEPFYKWFRDVAAGKITDMGAGFFRIVLPEHLIITPIVLIISSLLMRDEKHHLMWRILLFLALIILVLDFSRIYLLGLVFGLLILKYKHKWSRWLIVSATTLGLFVLIFTSLFMLVSGGKSLGLELFGIRITSIAVPRIEASAATRMMVLPAAWQLATESPLLGQGLGAQVTFRNTITYELVTTKQFDWGYIEMLAELGIVGSIALLSLVFLAIFKLIQKIKSVPDWHDFYVGLLAGIFSMLVINITSPALFHVFGIIFLALIIPVAIKPAEAFDQMVTVLYRIFNRLKN